LLGADLLARRVSEHAPLFVMALDSTCFFFVDINYCNPEKFCGRINFAVFAVASGPQN
jgi:hypothetical protein